MDREKVVMKERMEGSIDRRTGMEAKDTGERKRKGREEGEWKW